MVRNYKKHFGTLAKLSVAAGLICWLVMSDKLDFSQLAILGKNPEILGVALLYWVVCSVVICSLRWRLLLQAFDYKISFWRALHLQTVGNFFNSTMPGAVGGDLIKVYYAIKDNPQRNRSGAFVSILLDRLIGLAGIFCIGTVAIVFQYFAGTHDALMLSIVVMMASFMAFLAIFFGAALYRYQREDPFLRLLKMPFLNRRLSIIRRLYEAVREYRNHRSIIINGLLLSIVNQVGSLTLFCLIAKAIAPDMVNYVAIVMIFPLGMLITALPLAPGGIGVGHVAFENLFRMVGMSHGADIFNAFVLVQIALNTLGVIPYLYLKKNKGVNLNDCAALSTACK